MVFFAFSVDVVLANDFDWDLFFSFHEVDRRSWVLDHRPPLWSYQLCAGTTRIGDPQAFGLSPLFALVLLFGPFWGSKLAVLLSLAIGLAFATRLLALFAGEPAGQGGASPATLTLATLLLTSNYFVWHLLFGHFSFVSYCFGLGIVYYTFKGFLGGLAPRELASAVLVTWQHYTGGWFHSAVYLLAPFGIAFALFVVATAVLGWRGGPGLPRPAGRRLAGAAGFHLAGLLLASYKLAAVWQHQQAHPRGLEPVTEQTSLLQLVGHHLVPTVGTRWALALETSGPWALHECSAFSLLPLALLVLVARLAGGRARAATGGGRPGSPPLGLFAVLYFVLSGALAMGSFADLAPFPVLNALVFQESVRVATRFGVGVTLSLAMACALLLRRTGPAGLGPGACWLLLLLSLANLSGFGWMLDLPRAMKLASLPAESRASSRLLTFAEAPAAGSGPGFELEARTTSQMYGVLRAGLGVIDCYNSLERDPIEGWPPGRTLWLVDERHGEPGRPCLEQSSFTQNEVRIAASCPPFVCLNLAALNPRERLPGVGYDPARNRYCRDPARAPGPPALADP
jgi:hypothetical protein